MSRPIVLTGGGTGGHVFPLRAVADALLGQGVGRDELLVVGSRRGQEGVLLADLGIDLVLLPGRGIRRSASPRALAQNLGAVLGLLVAGVRGLALVARRRPRAVVSVGGYAAAAAGFAAVVLARPLVLVVLDARPGLVHRLLAPFAVAICTAYPSTARRVVVTGTPVREEIGRVTRTEAERLTARERLGLSSGLVVAVVSGSLGASSVNRAAAELAVRWGQTPPATLYHVTGRRDLDVVLARRAAAGGDDEHWRVVPFESHMADLWSSCDVAVCRAGATTVAELCAAGVPSILVPLPGAPGGHQDANAAVLATAGAAVVIDDADLDADSLEAALRRLLASTGEREAMSRAARALSHPDAAARVAATVLARAD